MNQVIRRFRTWMRVVLPRSEIGLFVIFGILAIDGTYLSIVFRNWPPPQDFFVRARLGWLSFCALAYGVYRATAFHPLCDPDYRRWLELTPWNSKHPLPAGPLWPKPQDVVVLLALVGLSHEFSPLTIVIPLLFLCGYLISNLILNWLAGEWTWAYFVAFGLTSVPLLYPRWEYLLPAGLLLLLPAYAGTRSSLRRFPWQLSLNLESQFYKPAKEALQERRLGWPYELLAPTPPRVWITPHDGICLSLLLGWFEFSMATMAFNILAQAPFPPPMFVIGMIPIFVISLSSIIALGTTYVNYWSPIDVWGRICTLRWLIPRYDIMAATPAAAVIVSGLFHASQRIDVGAIGTTIAFLLLLVFSPSVENWRLTGEHRVVFNSKGQGQEFIQI